MPEFLKDPIVLQYVITGVNLLAAIIVIIASLYICRNRRHTEKATKLLREASINVQGTFDSMLETMISMLNLKKGVNPTQKVDKAQLMLKEARKNETSKQ